MLFVNGLDGPVSWTQGFPLFMLFVNELDEPLTSRLCNYFPHVLQVRVWQIFEDHIVSRSHVDLVANMKEHKGKVTAIQIHPNDRSCVSASTDGSTIIWDLE